MASELLVSSLGNESTVYEMTKACRRRIKEPYLQRGRVLSLPLIRAYRKCSTKGRKCKKQRWNRLHHLRGIENVGNFKPKRGVVDGDIFNTDINAGKHWFALLYADCLWYLFDCSVLTPIDDHVMIINKLHHNVVLQVAQLQTLDSMTCGEH